LSKSKYLKVCTVYTELTKDKVEEECRDNWRDMVGEQRWAMVSRAEFQEYLWTWALDGD
jgi:hypothetical protein